MLSRQLCLRSETRCMKVNITNIINGYISHENAINNLIREYIMRRGGGLGKEVRLFGM